MIKYRSTVRLGVTAQVCDPCSGSVRRPATTRNIRSHRERTLKRLLTGVAVLWLAGWCGALTAAGPLFLGLGDRPGGTAKSVSADGSVVVGRISTARGVEAFHWSDSSGVTVFGHLAGGQPVCAAYGASVDGSVVVGYAVSAEGEEAFRWTKRSGLVGLGELPGGAFASRAFGVSADGSVVVGWSVSASGSEAFRWTEHSGMGGIGDLPDGDCSSIAYGVSADGSTVVGEGASAHGNEAFRWTEQSGMVGLGDLPGGVFDSTAIDVSADGSVVVGKSQSASRSEAFRWTSEGGMAGLGCLPGHTESAATGVSADGSVVVGWSGSKTEAFIWDSRHGMRRLGDVLTNLGTDIVGWRLTCAVDISADGKLIVGTALGPRSKQENWLAKFEPLPETAKVAPFTHGKSALLIALSALAAIGAWWHRQLARALSVCARRFSLGATCGDSAVAVHGARMNQ